MARRKITLRDWSADALAVRIAQYKREGKPIGPFVAELKRRAKLAERPQTNPFRRRRGPWPRGKTPPHLRKYLFR